MRCGGGGAVRVARRDRGLPPWAARALTGKIDDVTIDLKEMKKAEKAEEDKVRAEAAHEKARSEQYGRKMFLLHPAYAGRGIRLAVGTERFTGQRNPPVVKRVGVISNSDQ